MATPSTTMPDATPTDQPGPISPVHRTTTFPHKTSPAVVSQTPLIDMSTPAINAAPVELDGIDTSVEVEHVRRRRLAETGASVGNNADVDATSTATGGGVLSPGDEDDIDAEFLADADADGANAGRDARQKRAAILAQRSKDPSVIVDVPQDPTAEEVQAAKSAEGTVTPGLPVPAPATLLKGLGES